MVSITSAPILAGTIVSPTFNRSPAFPSTPNGRFPQEVGQVVQFKQFKKLRDADKKAGLPAKSDIEYRKIAAAGVGLSAFAMVGLGESAASQSTLLTGAGSAIGTIGGILCYTGYGCAIGGPMVVIGGLTALAGQSVCVIRDCSIKVKSDGTVDGANIEGDSVKSIQPKPISAGAGPYPYLDENGGGATPDNFKNLLTTYGVNREFIVVGSQGRIRKAIIVGYTKGSGTMLRSTFGDYVDSAADRYGPTWPRDPITFRSCFNGGECKPNRLSAAGTNTACAPYAQCVIFYTSEYYAAANQAALIEHVPVQQVPFFGLGSGNQLPPEKAAQIVHPDVISIAANSVWKAQGAEAPVPYDSADQITAADVQEYRNQWPDRASSLADLARPVNAPGQPPKIGPIDDPVTPPAQVEVTNPAYNPDKAATGDKDEPDTDDDEELDEDEGLLGDIMEPARDFFSGPFKKFITPGITLPATASTCPVISIDLPTLLGHREIARPQDSGFVCDWMNQQRPLFLGLLHLVYSVGALVIVFKRS